MQYTTEIIINCPLEKTIELFDSVENLKKWQVGLLSMETIEGQPGKAGAKSRLVYQMGKGEFIMEEEIIENKLPESIHFIYRSGKTMETVNDNKNFFSRTEDGNTIWKQENTFKMKGFWGLMSIIAPGMFRKQTLNDMNRFKEFAEQ